MAKKSKPIPVRVTVKQTFSETAQTPGALPKTDNHNIVLGQKKWYQWLWWFLWHDNSIWSWIANIIIAFILIKFVVYPLLGLALGTSLPVVAVVSGSMEHDGSFDDWWSDKACCANGECKSQSQLYGGYDITTSDFNTYRFPNGFNKGDLMILGSTKSLHVGDVVVFNAFGVQDPVIHRVVLMTDGTVSTKGDHNCGTNSFESNIPQNGLYGKALLRIPLLGWIKIGFVYLIDLVRGVV